MREKRAFWGITTREDQEQITLPFSRQQKRIHSVDWWFMNWAFPIPRNGTQSLLDWFQTLRSPLCSLDVDLMILHPAQYPPYFFWLLQPLCGPHLISRSDQRIPLPPFFFSGLNFSGIPPLSFIIAHVILFYILSWLKGALFRYFPMGSKHLKKEWRSQLPSENVSRFITSGIIRFWSLPFGTTNKRVLKILARRCKHNFVYYDNENRPKIKPQL